MDAAGALPQQTPWFEEFKQEFFRMLAFSDLETFDHPVACVDLTCHIPLHLRSLLIGYWRAVLQKVSIAHLAVLMLHCRSVGGAFPC